MNNVLQLKGPFQGRKHPRAVVIPSLAKGDSVSSEHLSRLATQLEDCLNFWSDNPYIDGALVTAHYERIVPKSRRLSYIFNGEKKTTSDNICGARFEKNENNSKSVNSNRHVFTYYISLDVLKNAINKIKLCADIINSKFNGIIYSHDIAKINNGEISLDKTKKNLFTSVIVDCSMVLFFNVEENRQKADSNSLISLYKTNTSILTTLRRVGIDINDDKLLDDCTVSLRQDQLDLLLDKAPYLISMINDFSKYDIPAPSPDKITIDRIIPSPNDEPTIGVIDTRFDKNCYFAEWVDYHDLIAPALGVDPDDYFHGTAVSSLIVDGPHINPDLEDGCGRFKVRHFAVSKASGSSSFTILKSIQEIVKNNRDIKVWNLSLGSKLQINENFISPEAYFLDELQSEYDVIFVVAGTNDSEYTLNKRIGAPADSLNSLVVNAVDFDGKTASYSRKGPVLSFFYKPDVAYYGGDSNKKMRVCGPLGESTVTGTSFAAPWVTRKIAFLIYKMGLNKEVSKALIIDAAAGWNPQDNKSLYLGYGIVPIHINDILKTKDDEIRFVISNVINEYETYMYSLPIPIVKNMQPFWSRATMTYFPICNRYQGVDYTCTEMDLHFGRVYGNRQGKTLLKEINDNKQSTDEISSLYEEPARLLYRKWDNVKRISETIKSVGRPKKSYGAGMWGIRVVTKERGNEKHGRGLHFGIVVTLKEMNGVNRISDFIKLCEMYGWLVTPIDVDTSLNLYSHVNEDIEWD